MIIESINAPWVLDYLLGTTFLVGAAWVILHVVTLFYCLVAADYPNCWRWWASLRHRWAHRVGANTGHVETWTRRDGTVMVGFRCDGCGETTGVRPIVAGGHMHILPDDYR